MVYFFLFLFFSDSAILSLFSESIQPQSDPSKAMEFDVEQKEIIDLTSVQRKTFAICSYDIC